MPKIKNNPLLEGLSGKIGGLVFRRMKDGSTVVAAAPNFSKRVLSKKQRAHHSRFQQAADYASQAAKTEPIYTELAEGTLKNPYNIALSDWFHAPEIHTVTWSTEHIRIHATDNVQVTCVRVTISDAQGKMIEQGEAKPGKNSWWEYKTKARGSLLVEVWDLPGNITLHES